jgi:hypothetical protein
VPLAPVADGDPPLAGEDREGAETVEAETLQQDCLPLQAGEGSGGAATDILAPAQPSWRAGQDPGTESGIGRGLIGKTRAWFRHASMSRRQQLD